MPSRRRRSRAHEADGWRNCDRASSSLKTAPGRMSMSGQGLARAQRLDEKLLDGKSIIIVAGAPARDPLQGPPGGSLGTPGHAIVELEALDPAVDRRRNPRSGRAGDVIEVRPLIQSARHVL